MSNLIRKKINDFNVQAYHQGEFKEITQESLKGQWSIFFFYPADFTFVCPTELGDLADNYEKFKEIGAENGDQVCPAKWTPGADTLTPSLDLVGKL